MAVVTNEIVSRTYPELAVMAPYDAERTIWDVEETAYPHQGSGQILFDFGNSWPTDRGNLPPQDDLPDPHSRIAEVEEVGRLLESWFADRTIIDVCGGDGCRPN